MTIRSSQAAVDLIVMEEVTSKNLYNLKYQHPEWPGGMSGVTIGIGYDVGFSTPTIIQADWGDKLPVAMVAALEAVAGIHGTPASSHAHELRNVVTVPWAAAMAVFLGRDMPKWEATVLTHLPNSIQLAPDSFGALVSLAYNRGPSFSAVGDRYREMRAIRDHLANQQFEEIPDDFRSMRRLWPNVVGLRNRRDHEAALFEKGLKT
jgi:lysozyme